MMEITLGKVSVHGRGLDSATRCIHYRTPADIIAIKFRCCRTYYSCFYCHQEEAEHPAQQWPESDFGEAAILCGACGSELTIREYLTCNATCPACGAAFNPGCALHYGLYFEFQFVGPRLHPTVHQR
jgi:uncharacterized CHY-type Zn-finger protein